MHRPSARFRFDCKQHMRPLSAKPAVQWWCLGCEGERVNWVITKEGEERSSVWHWQPFRAYATLYRARVQHQECRPQRVSPHRTASNGTVGRLYARVQMYWAPNTKKRFHDELQLGGIESSYLASCTLLHIHSMLPKRLMVVSTPYSGYKSWPVRYSGGILATRKELL